MKTGIRELQREIDRLNNVWRHPDILALREKILAERKPQIDALKNQISELKSKTPAKKSRFPENVPQEVMSICNDYWHGTTEFDKFRIHIWNDKAVWTSYPSGGYYTNAGYNPASAHFYLLSLTEKTKSFGRNIPKCYFDVEGRNSEKKLRKLLEEKTKQ